MTGATEELERPVRNGVSPERRKGGSGFDDNQLLGALFGQHDENLARIEQLLNVRIASRGNRLAVEGAPAACELAGRVLNNLYQHLREGRAIEHGDVDGAVRWWMQLMQLSRKDLR